MKTIVVGSVAASVLDLLSQVPADALLLVVFVICVPILVVLFYEPACARLIRIIKAFGEVRQTKEH